MAKGKGSHNCNGPMPHQGQKEDGRGHVPAWKAKKQTQKR